LCVELRFCGQLGIRDFDMKTGKPVKIGDIFQILSREGICYGQILYKHKKWGYIIGVFRNFYDEEPTDFSDIVNRKPDFIVPFLINIAVSRGYFVIVGHTPIADCNTKFPIFRGTNNLGEGSNTLWWFWDGEREWRVDRPLTEIEKRYPRKSLISAPLLIQYVEDDYRVERDYI
jgi:hypothetical protein